MENYYGLPQNKTNKNILNSKYQLLSELDESYVSQLDSKSLIHYFCNDLRKILEYEDIQKMIRHLNQLDQILVQLKEDELNQEIPHLDDFFRSLSPILLRSIDQSIDSFTACEENSQNENCEDSLLKGWLESIRIAVEEEIHIWQEKII